MAQNHDFQSVEWNESKVIGLTLSLAPKYESDSESSKGAPASDDEERDFDWGLLNVESEFMMVAQNKCNKITSIFFLLFFDF